MIPPGISEHPIGNVNPILFAAGLAAAVDRLIDDTAAGEGIAGKIVVTVFPGNIKAAENIRHILRGPAPPAAVRNLFIAATPEPFPPIRQNRISFSTAVPVRYEMSADGCS